MSNIAAKYTQVLKLDIQAPGRGMRRSRRQAVEGTFATTIPHPRMVNAVFVQG